MELSFLNEICIINNTKKTAAKITIIKIAYVPIEVEIIRGASLNPAKISLRVELIFSGNFHTDTNGEENAKDIS